MSADKHEEADEETDERHHYPVVPFARDPVGLQPFLVDPGVEGEVGDG